MKTPQPSHSPVICFVYIQNERRRESFPGVKYEVAGEWTKCIHRVTADSHHYENTTVFGHYDLAEAVCRVHALRNMPVILVVVKAGNVLMRVLYNKKLLKTLEERSASSGEVYKQRPLLRSLNSCRTPLFGYPDSHVLQRNGVAV